MSESDAMAVMESQVPLPLLHRGKVRDVYDAGPGQLLMVASDRVSAFDVILRQPIPRKGEVLTQLTAWWLDSLRGILDHHLLSCDTDGIIDRIPSLRNSREAWARRSMLVHRTEPVLIECVVRGYVSGSAWKEYRTEGTLAGEPLPEGLVESQKLPAPIFSPSTKAQTGHDENMVMVPTSLIDQGAPSGKTSVSTTTIITLTDDADEQQDGGDGTMPMMMRAEKTRERKRRPGIR